ncbi:MAG: response regulator [Candidatus Omnitrophica bacterium]|nr:response regulator [Candidatus Omnitrophota bacterium]
MEEKLFTVEEVVQYLKLPKSTIYKLSQTKELPSFKIGKQLRFRKSSLDRYFEQKEGTLKQLATTPAKRILLVDDDALILRSLAKFLASHGYQVETAQSGEEALKNAQETSFDLMITDVRMPQMNGIETLKAMRKLQTNFNRPDIPEMIITGFADSQAQKELQDLGINDFIYKPFVTTDFIKTIEGKLREKKET